MNPIICVSGIKKGKEGNFNYSYTVTLSCDSQERIQELEKLKRDVQHLLSPLEEDEGDDVPFHERITDL